MIILSPRAVGQTSDESERAWVDKLIQQRFPEFSLKDIDGNNQVMNGKIAVFNFWSTGCSICIKEIPDLNRLKQKYKDSNIIFIAVCTEPRNAVEKLQKKGKFEYTLIPDGGSLDEALQVPVYPTHVVVDQNGSISDVVIGGNEILSDLDQRIQKLSTRD